jgi:hypothetical protein
MGISPEEVEKKALVAGYTPGRKRRRRKCLAWILTTEVARTN